MWAWFFGTPSFPFSPPYKRQSPITGEDLIFETTDEAVEHALLLEEGKYTLGQELWFHVPMFADVSWFFEDWMWDAIQEYHYCTRFNIPLAKSIDEAPAFRLDCFTIIEKELNACQKMKSTST